MQREGWKSWCLTLSIPGGEWAGETKIQQSEWKLQTNYFHGSRIDKTAENYGDEANWEAAWWRVTLEVRTWATEKGVAGSVD